MDLYNTVSDPTTQKEGIVTFLYTLQLLAIQQLLPILMSPHPHEWLPSDMVMEWKSVSQNMQFQPISTSGRVLPEQNHPIYSVIWA